MKTYKITDRISFETIEQLLKESIQLELSSAAKKAIQQNRDYLDRKLNASKDPIYGINTGFGSLHNKHIADSDLEKLQVNLVMSHACGTGAEVPQEIVQLMLLLKIQGLAQGYSGVQLEVVQRLVDFYNHGVYPVVYEQGSLGASGDLAPLAHLCLPLIGMGDVYFQGKRMKASTVLNKLQLKTVKLKSKEGLALLNGTQFMSAYGVHCVLQARKLSRCSDIIASLSLDAFDCHTSPFDPELHDIRPHAGQAETAAAIRKHRKGSAIAARKKSHVQDPYSFRCIPQVHGASKDAIRYVEGVVLTEINSVTDNPTVFEKSDKIISGGNFHGQPLAIAYDFLAIALAELGNISERRTYQLISGQRGLPPFLIADAGLNSGFMIPQYTAASIVSQNKQLCAPASVDSIVSSNGQEDHVSMGANAATKCHRVVANLHRILAVELLNAAQAFEFRRPAKSSAFIEKLYIDYRKQVKFMQQDRYLHEDMMMSEAFLADM